MTIERTDNNKNYQPDNCKWANRKQQAKNRATTIFIEFGGVTMSLQEWSASTGINAPTLWARLKHGWPTERALHEPIRNY